jgi:hypothetical protein
MSTLQSLQKVREGDAMNVGVRKRAQDAVLRLRDEHGVMQTGEGSESLMVDHALKAVEKSVPIDLWHLEAIATHHSDPLRRLTRLRRHGRLRFRSIHGRRSRLRPSG